MANRTFTEEEMRHLRESSYILKVTPNIVHFSAEFKQKFWEALYAGKMPQDIVVGLGIDADILGAIRISGIKAMIKKEAASGKGFRDINMFNETLNGYVSSEMRIKHLEQQLAYKNQEIEFLKKIVSLGRGEAES